MRRRRRRDGREVYWIDRLIEGEAMAGHGSSQLLRKWRLQYFFSVEFGVGASEHMYLRDLERGKIVKIEFQSRSIDGFIWNGFVTFSVNPLYLYIDHTEHIYKNSPNQSSTSVHSAHQTYLWNFPEYMYIVSHPRNTSTP